MSTLTANYGLTKPAVTENYSVPIVNANNDIIDSTIKSKDDLRLAAEAAINAAVGVLDTRLDIIEGLEIPVKARLHAAGSAVVATTPGTQLPGSSTLAITLARKTLCLINFRAWLDLKMTSGTGDLRAYVGWTGANTGDLVEDWNGTTTYGNLLTVESISTDTTTKKLDSHVSLTMTLLAGTTTFAARGYRTGAGSFSSSTVAYPVLEITPLRWVA